MTKALLIFPHQLFNHHPGLDKRPDRICLIEDTLFFGDRQYPMRFHKQKLWLHRASMARYAKRLEGLKPEFEYIRYEAFDPIARITIWTSP
mgnify:FL=1